MEFPYFARIKHVLIFAYQIVFKMGILFMYFVVLSNIHFIFFFVNVYNIKYQIEIISYNLVYIY